MFFVLSIGRIDGFLIFLVIMEMVIIWIKNLILISIIFIILLDVILFFIFIVKDIMLLRLILEVIIDLLMFYIILLISIR